MIKHGDWNEIRLAFGRRGTGKSTLALEWACQLSRDSYIIVHDPARGFPDSLPGERTPRVTRHSNLASAIRTIESRGAGIHAVPTESTVEVLTAAKALAARSLRKGKPWPWQKDRPTMATPVTVIIDEGVTLLLDDETSVRKAITQVMTQGRHLHMGLILTCQHANLINYRLLDLATEIAVFQTSGTYSLDKLKACGVPREACEMAKDLPDYQYLSYRPGCRDPAEHLSTGNGITAKL